MGEEQPENVLTPPPTRIGPAGGGAVNRHPAWQDLLSDKLLVNCRRIDYQGGPVPSVGGLAILAKLGQGGMGAVYLAIHPRLENEVAIKILPFQLAAESPQNIKRFFQEAKLAARVKSPHLAAVTDVNEDGGLYYLVMEYVQGVSGGTYQRQLRAAGSTGLAEADALAICIAATEGLAAAHAEGIIHRDVKPDNILIPRSKIDQSLTFGAAKLTDLGLARCDSLNQSLTGSNVLGTPGFMAPEQVTESKTAGKPADVFSMAATLHDMIFGQAPFKGSSAMATIIATVQAPLEPMTRFRSDISAPTIALIEKCLVKNPAKRYIDAHALLMALKVCQEALKSPDAQTRALQDLIVLHASPEVGARAIPISTSPGGNAPTLPPIGATGAARTPDASAEATAPTLIKVKESDAAPKPGRKLIHLTNILVALAALAALVVAIVKLSSGVDTKSDSESLVQNNSSGDPALPLPKELTLDVGSGIKLSATLIPKGKFKMGSLPGEEGRSRDEGPQREVAISDPFYMGKYLVTQGQYESVMKSNPSRFKGSELPVECVSWDDAQEFCSRLGAKTGQLVILPSEAQWEYACRAGTSTAFNTGKTLGPDQANFDGQYRYGGNLSGQYIGHTVRVGSHPPNDWGLFDMHGNVFEWCQDSYTEDYRTIYATDPLCNTGSQYRVLRGGSWNYGPLFCRSAARFWLPAFERGEDFGFRVLIKVKKQ